MNSILDAIKPKSDQLNADDLIGRPLTIKITGIDIRPGDQPVSVHFDGDGGKPYKPCKSMSRVLVHVWGDDAKKYIGRSLTLYRDEKVIFGGAQVGGIRISHMSNLEQPRTVMLTATKASRKPFTVQPLKLASDADAISVQKDKVAEGVRDLVERIQDADGASALQAITGDQTVIKQRAYLAKSRPELAQQVDDAIATALAVNETANPFDVSEDDTHTPEAA
ncbi:MAG: hypothetical protein KGI54_16735 [Pseudomonadota bacterium]|nr:hypothetical protein [Pseudomonadota bacterium]